MTQVPESSTGWLYAVGIIIILFPVAYTVETLNDHELGPLGFVFGSALSLYLLGAAGCLWFASLHRPRGLMTLLTIFVLATGRYRRSRGC